MEEKLPEIYTEEVNDILSNPPASIVRYGIVILFIVVFLLFVGSWFIKYPDKISTRVNVFTSQVPANMAAKTNGKITHLFVSDNQMVKSGEILAVIENSSEYLDVLHIDSTLIFFDIENDSALINISQISGLLLGDIQSDFTTFQKNINDFLLFKNSNLLLQKSKALKKQLSMTNLYYNRLSEQSNLQHEDLEIGKTEFQRDSSLYIQKVISAAEYDKSKAAYIQRKQSYMSSRTNLSNIQIQKAQVEQQIIEIDLQIEEETKKYKQAIIQSEASLANAVNSWKNICFTIANRWESNIYKHKRNKSECFVWRYSYDSCSYPKKRNYWDS